MQIAYKNVTSDPFVIYRFYELLEKESSRLKIRDKPEHWYNLDETSFPTDPSKTSYVGIKGEKSIKVIPGANRTNTTVLATICADGMPLDPFIIFKGQQLRNNYLGSDIVKELPNTGFGKSKNGWMTVDIFHEWFCGFVKQVEKRPLIVIFDGHVSHLGAETVTLAEKEKISLIKLPSHCTDVLQPLDVSCFAPLKKYEDRLNEHVDTSISGKTLNRAEFCNLLSMVWKDGLSESNIKSGFCTTGIFPVNKNKYDTNRLDAVKLKTYEKWRKDGSKVDKWGEPILSQLLSCQSSSVNEVVTDGLMSPIKQTLIRDVQNCLSPVKKLSSTTPVVKNFVSSSQYCDTVRASMDKTPSASTVLDLNQLGSSVTLSEWICSKESEKQLGKDVPSCSKSLFSSQTVSPASSHSLSQPVALTPNFIASFHQLC